MAGDQFEIMQIRDDFYRDGFYRILFVFLSLLAAIAFLGMLSFYLYFSKPPPVRFATDTEWRVLPPVPLNEPYLKLPDLIQWISEVIPASFTFDFVNYAKQLQNVSQYYTPNGFGKLIQILNNNVNEKTVEEGKLFVNTTAAGAPFILNQGVLQKSYAWWIQIPVNIRYITVGKSASQELTLQALVIRVSTLNNLNGVAIDNLIVAKGGGGQPRSNG